MTSKEVTVPDLNIIIPDDVTIDAYTSDDLLKEISDLLDKHVEVIGDVDVNIPAEREKAKSAAYNVSRSKTVLTDLAAKLIEKPKQTVKQVNDAKKAFEKIFDKARDSIKGTSVEFEEKLKIREQEYRRKIEWLRAQGEVSFSATSKDVQATIDELDRFAIEGWGAFEATALDAKSASLTKLREAFTVIKDREDAAVTEATATKSIEETKPSQPVAYDGLEEIHPHKAAVDYFINTVGLPPSTANEIVQHIVEDLVPGLGVV